MIQSVLDSEPGHSVKEENGCEMMKKTNQCEIFNDKVNKYMPSSVKPWARQSDSSKVIQSVLDSGPGHSVKKEKDCEKMTKTKQHEIFNDKVINICLRR